MSEFKFACPVCGQHITADSSSSGGHLECPTCFQKIIVPQAPASADPKFIVSAAQVAKPRPTGMATESGPLPISPARTSVPLFLVLVLVVGAAGAAFFVFGPKALKAPDKPNQLTTNGMAKGSVPVIPPKVYPIPTNVLWTLDLTNVSLPEDPAAGSIHGSGFFCERATLQGGSLTLRQGKTGPADLGVTVNFFAHEGQELSGKSVEITPERPPPVPQVTLRWKNDEQKQMTRKIAGGYAMRITFGEAMNNHITGKIYISLPDENKSFVAGSFNAEIKKAPTPKPKAPKPPGSSTVAK